MRKTRNVKYRMGQQKTAGYRPGKTTATSGRLGHKIKIRKWKASIIRNRRGNIVLNEWNKICLEEIEKLELLIKKIDDEENKSGSTPDPGGE